MDKKLRVAEIAARTGLSPSTVSRVRRESEYQRQGAPGGAGLRPRAGCHAGLAAGRLLLNHLLVFARSAHSMSDRISSTTG